MVAGGHCHVNRVWPQRTTLIPFKVGRVLDLYHLTWQGTPPLRDDEFVVSTDEKTSPRRSSTSTSATWLGRNLAALDVHCVKLSGHCEF